MTETVSELSTNCPKPLHGVPYYSQVHKSLQIMRKIESQMNAAISNNTDWKSANTEVIHTCDNVNAPVSHVFLHGNKIAEVGDNFIKLFDGGWQSNTTKSRLNAILSEHGISGECVFQKNFEWFIRLFNGTEFFVTEFRSGMRLGALTASDLLV